MRDLPPHRTMQDDEIDRLKAQLKEYEEKGRVLMDISRDLKGRVTELEEFVADTATACQRSLDPDWVPDWVTEALAPLAERCRALLGDDPEEYESAWLLRKQAEAVEPAIRTALRSLGNADLSEDDIADFAESYAQRLHQQADDIEKAGGIK